MYGVRNSRLYKVYNVIGIYSIKSYTVSFNIYVKQVWGIRQVSELWIYSWCIDSYDKQEYNYHVIIF